MKAAEHDMQRMRISLFMVAAVVLAFIGGVLLPRPGASNPALAGTVLPARQAPNFHLTDQFGRTLSLRQLHGRAVVVTFLQATCTGQCPVVAETMRRTLDELGPAAKKVAVVVISADPEGDTRSAVLSFSRKHGMLHRWYYLTASRPRLVPVWHAFYVYVAPKNALEKLRQAHTSATYVLDGQGRERVLMTSNPDTGTLVRDLRILLGLTPQAAGADSVPAPQAGHPAPAFQLRSLSGSTVRLHDLRGHVVVLNFWATWCTACRSEMPMLARWSKAVRSSGVVVLGIDQQESARDAAAFVRRYRVPYPILLDSSGDVSATYGVAGLPTSLVVDRHGMVHAVRAGILDQSFLTKDVMPLARSHE